MKQLRIAESTLMYVTENYVNVPRVTKSTTKTIRVSEVRKEFLIGTLTTLASFLRNPSEWSADADYRPSKIVFV